MSSFLTKAFRKSKPSLHNNTRYNYTSNLVKHILNKNVQHFQSQNEIRALNYIWNLQLNKTNLENNIHNYYCKLLQLLCDKSISFKSISDNFSDEINEFIHERNCHPGIPYFHFFRFQNNFFEYDFGLSNINIDICNIQLLLDFSNQILLNNNANINTKNNENNNEFLISKLRSLYKDEESFNEAYNKILNENSNNYRINKNENKKNDNLIEINIDINKPLNVYLKVEISIKHGNNDWEFNNEFKPSLVGDFIDISPNEMNRMFYWEIITQIPIGFIDINNDKDKEKYIKKIQSFIEKEIKNGLGVNDFDKDSKINFNKLPNILWNYSLSKYWRQQNSIDISMWKVMQANEQPF